MKSKLLLVLLLNVIAFHSVFSKPSRPHYIECASSEECGSLACCVIGLSRFSLPSCMPLQEMDHVCTYMNDQPHNITVYYPDGAEVELTNVFRTYCPCEHGLSCSPEGTCHDPNLEDDLNSIFSNH